jgi:hypothetical protein
MVLLDASTVSPSGVRHFKLNTIDAVDAIDEENQNEDEGNLCTIEISLCFPASKFSIDRVLACSP